MLHALVSIVFFGLLTMLLLKFCGARGVGLLLIALAIVSVTSSVFISVLLAPIGLILFLFSFRRN